MAQPPYLLVPQSNPIASGQTSRSRPSFVLPPYSTVTPSSQAGTSAQAGQGTSSHPTSTSFKAPAHRHAHHLHTIPPREKSTRTLIIDHILWVHARTRFAQARAELGMTDRCGGSDSSNYAYRERPENYDEEEEIESDGETVDALFIKRQGPVTPAPVIDPMITIGGTLGLAFGAPQSRTEREEEDELRRRKERQDLRLAKSLKLRAEGLEKTVTSMLDQPPPVHPFPDDLMTPKQTRTRIPHPHTLPNGVRLRLALATLYNDLFSRGRPPPAAANGMPDGLPYVLGPLSIVSSVRTNDTAKSGGVVFAKLWSDTQTAYRQPRASSLEPDERAIHLYAAGARPRLTNTTYTYPPPSTRCSRHLYSGCPICLELSTRPATTRFGFAPGLSCSLVRAEWKGKYRVRNGGAVADCEKEESLAEVVVRFIRLSALVAMELAREVGHIGVDEEDSGEEGEDGEQDSSKSPEGGGETATSPINRGGYPTPSFTVPQQVISTQYTVPAPLPNGVRVPPSSASNASSSVQPALQPTRDWYILLIGLLTRAALEGYLVGGWEGYKAVECLFGVGLGLQPTGSIGPSYWNGKDSKDEEEDEEEELMKFEPDDLPDLVEAIRILFPSLKHKDVSGWKSQSEGIEKEYQREMKERQKKFFDISPDVTDLSSHLEELAVMFPAEPVERAALRYYEAIAKWRGKPELETYKKRPPKTWTNPETSSMMEAFLRSNPTSPASADNSIRSRKQPIEKYFTSPSSSAARRKRGRSRSPMVEGLSLGGPGKRTRADNYPPGSMAAFLA
ncbi:hypothetical protein NEOLEDRAFT_569648 [Neolentinus lepideus HHB14362 ss-1]|uniref:Uncharacterized protein n=1 Tax=Neolentinus lepideus HHB14362 ss-1 TaxID=1314782 RepID=A0A165QZC8_9AGAM|nr:hypothetical protein NEOLEDRAFT_569648 [Neolentinus lepideus HHB14362 ss-1]